MALFMAGCAPARLASPANQQVARPSSTTHGEIPVWRLAALAEATQPLIALRSTAGVALNVDAKRIQLMHAAAERVLAAAGAGETPDWLLVGTYGINAYATYQQRQPVIGVTLGMMALLKDDQDAWAALFGHELAHFRLGHHRAHRERNQATELGSSLAGLLLSAAGVGFGSVVADATGKLVERSFSRDDERDADSSGLGYQRRAGFDGAGALRLQQRLLDATHNDSLPGFLSTHPGGSERIERLRRLLEDADTALSSSPAEAQRQTAPHY